jgi:hypothetical protein
MSADHIPFQRERASWLCFLLAAVVVVVAAEEAQQAPPHLVEVVAVVAERFTVSLNCPCGS